MEWLWESTCPWFDTYIISCNIKIIWMYNVMSMIMYIYIYSQIHTYLFHVLEPSAALSLPFSVTSFKFQPCLSYHPTHCLLCVSGCEGPGLVQWSVCLVQTARSGCWICFLRSRLQFQLWPLVLNVSVKLRRSLDRIWLIWLDGSKLAVGIWLWAGIRRVLGRRISGKELLDDLDATVTFIVIQWS